MPLLGLIAFSIAGWRLCITNTRLIGIVGTVVYEDEYRGFPQFS